MYCLYSWLFVFMHNLWYLLVLNWYLVFMLSANTSPNSSAESMLLSQPPSTSNGCDGLNCASTDSVPVKLLGYNLNTSQRRHIANCRLNKLHFRYLHISTPTSKWPPPIFYYLQQINSSRKLSHGRHIDINILTYLLHGAEPFLRS